MKFYIINPVTGQTWTTQGWIVDDAVPGCGEPVLFDSEEAAMGRANEFNNAFQLLIKEQK